MTCANWCPFRRDLFITDHSKQTTFITDPFITDSLWRLAHNTAVTNNGRQNVLISRMVCSEFYEFIVKKDTFASFRGSPQSRSPPSGTAPGCHRYMCKFRLRILQKFWIIRRVVWSFHWTRRLVRRSEIQMHLSENDVFYSVNHRSLCWGFIQFVLLLK